MDVNTAATATAAVIGKSPERDIDAPPRIQPSKATNGVLKRHFLPHAPPKEIHASLGGVYKECLKNHAASIGGHALDGCGEFMPAPTATAADPTSLKCAACGCHRNFHRREPEDFPVVIEYHPHHRHHPLPPPTAHAPPPARESHSPPPISSYPHMLLALSGGGGGGGGGGATQNLMNSSGSGHPSTRKRFRTKFTQEQKEKMFELAERVGWKMQKTNEDVVNGVCSDIGVERGVFKVWMHNNKNTFAKRSSATNAVSDLRNGKNDDDEEENNNGGVVTHHTHLQEDDHHHHHHHHHHHYNGKSNESNAPTNASSSSS